MGRESFDYKSLTKDELKSTFNDIRFRREPWHHQLVAMAFAADKNRVNLFLDVRTGKSMVSLYIIQYLWGCAKTLIVCPSSAFGSWRQDIQEWTDLSYCLLVGNAERRKQLLSVKKDLYIINYEGLKSIYGNNCGKLCPDCGGKNKSCAKCGGVGVVGGWNINFNEIVHNFDCVIFDESHRLSSYKSLQSTVCFELSRKSKKVMGLTGTPIDGDLLGLFNVQKVIDMGRALGPNFYAYRFKYFNPPKFGYKWNLKKDCKEQILLKLEESAISFGSEECFDLPELQEIIRPVRPTGEFLEIQEQIINGRQLSLNEMSVEAFDMKARPTKLRELSSGFIFFDDSNNCKNTYVLKDNPKTEALLDIVKDNSSKIIVYHQFIPTGRIIEEELRKHKIEFVRARGGQNPMERLQTIEKFQKNEKVKVLIAHPTCASEGFDGSASNIVVFFDQVTSPKVRAQCVGRIRGDKQTKKCLVIDLVLEESIDEVAIKNRGKRTSFVMAAMEFIRNYTGDKPKRRARPKRKTQPKFHDIFDENADSDGTLLINDDHPEQ